MSEADIMALRSQAESALGGGAFADAVAAYRTLLAKAPGAPDDWYNLGYALRASRQFRAALDAYSQALLRGVRQPEAVHVNRAAILSEHLDRGEEAEKVLWEAIALNPAFIPAWLNLGNLAEDHGDTKVAREAYAKVRAIDPLNGRAAARLAGLDGLAGDADRAAGNLRFLLRDQRLTEDSRAEIGFALGNALDGLGRHAEAFAAVDAANAIRRRLAPAVYRYDRPSREALIDALIAAFPGPVTPPPTDARPPIFILGMFRSGSTLAEQVLARHSRVTAGGELEFVPGLVLDHLQPYPASLAGMDPAALAAVRDAYLGQMAGVFPRADMLTDKRCDNFLHVGLIMTLFPDARIVHTLRDPLDTILSTWFLDFDASIAYGTDLGDAAHWYRQYRRLMAHWKNVWPDAIHDHDYDRMVADPEPEIRRLATACGLDWEDGMLRAATAAQPVRTASAWQVRQPLHARSSGRWRHYERFLSPAIEELAKG